MNGMVAANDYVDERNMPFCTLFYGLAKPL